MNEQRRYDPIERPYFGLVHAFYAVMGGFAFYGSHDNDIPKSPSGVSTNSRYPVDVPKFDTIIYIMEHFPHLLTDFTKEDILDRAASSSLSKALLIVQVVWFCANSASRLAQSFPLSLLEVSTAAHAICTLVTYFVWWEKPINVATPTLLREQEAREVYALLKCSRDEYDRALEVAQRSAAGDSLTPTGPSLSEKIVLAAGALQRNPTPERPPTSLGFNSRDRRLIPGNFNNKSFKEDFYIPITMAVSPILYGLVHFLAWSDHFPTSVERLLWRVSSLVVTCSGIGEVLAVLTLEWVQNRYHAGRLTIIMNVAFVFIVPLTHVLASGYLIVASLRQLPFLDAATYKVPIWSNYWPHFS